MNRDYPDRGKLQISVTGANDMIPIENARVRITDPRNGDVLEELDTNNAGQTPEIELPAPPEEFSVVGGDERPYLTYNVTVRANERETLHIGGVQVFPNSTAMQRAGLKQATSGGFNVKNVLIGAHTLWGDYPAKIPEEEVKPLPDATGFVVLEQPVIPEYMIVHLGKPADSSAKNVWVPFADYIKNVASSEIYPTWETETVKANVLAITSFALNRVYTEWYRGKGYDFTVTNSTAFDQAFVEGRNIFERISVIVDDLFSTYITKEGIKQPLLTQYCDGKRTQCAGMTQWGSQDLGEQGYSAIQILKNFYGSEIYLDTAQKVSGVPLSYGGNPLERGSVGSDVAAIQKQLNTIATHYPAIPKNKEDGIYGENTEAAVRKFQSIFKLPQTGVVDFATWYAISNIYVAVTKMGELK